MADIRHLEGHLNPPYQTEKVRAYAKRTPYPFLLREACSDTGLPPQIVNRVLARLVRKGELTRQAVIVSYPQFNPHSRQWLANGRSRRVFQYSLVERA